MPAEVLFVDEAELQRAGRNIVIITFLSAYLDRDGLLILVHRFFKAFLSNFPGMKGLYLEYLDEHPWGTAPGYDLRISLVSLDELKRLAMFYEYNCWGIRIADIDIIVPQGDQFAKVSRAHISTALMLRTP